MVERRFLQGGMNRSIRCSPIATPRGGLRELCLPYSSNRIVAAPPAPPQGPRARLGPALGPGLNRSFAWLKWYIHAVKTAEGKRKFLVGIAGGSGSGKTTLAKKVLESCLAAGITGQIFSLDNYYRPLEHLPFEGRKVYNFDHPHAIDFALALEHLKRLRAGKAIRQPVYDFKVYTRGGTRLQEATQVILVEGLYALYPPELLALYDYKIFISTGIATAVLRRMGRDITERGRDVDGSKHQILTAVLPMYETYVKPTQRNAHFSINWDGEEIPEKATEGLVRMVRDYFR